MTDWLDDLLREAAHRAGVPCSTCNYGTGNPPGVIPVVTAEPMRPDDDPRCPDCGRSYGVYLWIAPLPGEGDGEEEEAEADRQ